MFDLKDFATVIPRDGFEWTRLRPVDPRLHIMATPQWFLVDLWVGIPELFRARFAFEFVPSPTDEVIEAHHTNWRMAKPFDDIVPAFDRLASVDWWDKDAIREFANEFGSLDVREWAATKKCRIQRMKTIHGGKSLSDLGSPEFGNAVNARHQGVVFGDPLNRWRGNVKTMKLCVGMFRTLLAGVEPDTDEEFVSMLPPSYTEHLRAPRYNWRESVARHILAFVNDNLANSCRPNLRLEVDRDYEAFSFHFRPESFQSAIWYEFALALQDMENFRECKTCGHLMRIGVNEDGSRKSRHYCSNACRMKALRGRQSKARELRARGMYLRDIAREFNTTMAVVKGWVADVPKP